MNDAENQLIDFKKYSEGWGGHGQINSDERVLEKWRDSMNEFLK